MPQGPGSEIVVVIRWTERGEFHEQGYGPIIVGEDATGHWPIVDATMRRWENDHPDAKHVNSTMYLLDPPAPAPEPVTP